MILLGAITSSCSFGRAEGELRDYPIMPVRLMEPFGAGGGPDVIARVLAPKLSELWGQPVTVENQPGAGSTAAPAFVAKSAAAITDVISDTIAGCTAYMMAPIQLALADIRDGKLVALGVTTKQRSSLLPEVLTIAEAGVVGYDYPIWYGIWAPAGTPPDVVKKLAKDIESALAAPDLRDWLIKHGADPMRMAQPEFERFVFDESERAAQIVKTAGIRRQ
jgi:tripartite-type tricarboxylate transporter receptor subunit TctC